MAEYIEREAAKLRIFEYGVRHRNNSSISSACENLERQMNSIPAADVRPVVTCADCKHNNACLTQAFVEDASRVPFDRNTFFCADGERRSNA